MALIRIYNKDTGNFDIYYNSNDIPNLENYYTKNEIDDALNNKANTNHTHSQYLTSADIPSTYPATSIIEDTNHRFITDELLTKLNGIEVGANKYIHPGYTSRVNGLYKITVDGTGHITNAVAVSKEDITALGIPSSDTNYYVTSASGNGNSTLTLTRNDGGKVSVNLSHSHSGYSLDGHTHEIDTLINSSGAKFSADWIPNLLASKITGGVFDVNRIPTLAISKISGLQTALDGKAPVDHTHNYAPSTHNHDSRYYTETEIDDKLVGYATNGHVHNQYLGRTEKAASASIADNATKWGGYEIEVGSGLPGGAGKITFNI